MCLISTGDISVKLRHYFVLLVASLIGAACTTTQPVRQTPKSQPSVVAAPAPIASAPSAALPPPPAAPAPSMKPIVIDPYIGQYCRPNAVWVEQRGLVEFRDGRERELLFLYCLSTKRQLVTIMCEPFGTVCKKLPYDKRNDAKMEQVLRLKQAEADKKRKKR